MTIGGCNTDSDEVEYYHEGFEFECGPNFTLDTFKKYAYHFKEHYFCKKHKAVNVDANLSVLPAELTLEVKDIEGEYWRIIDNPTTKIEEKNGVWVWLRMINECLAVRTRGKGKKVIYL
ncbi:hypothetical protein POM88_021758 [Heracleum sosnowskyi]|uniref:Uncharacterized protein n=1 Tax=Heracleum sosnowskyi TaxID=360622 RepID=A0AAD8IF62_9APIA|nr:hypothetical protein POM88_021758 [Heracleum sosnowskyi]